MPKLLSQQEVNFEWTDLNSWRQVKQPKSARVRSSGVHLSGIINYALVTSGLLEPNELEDTMPLRVCVGIAWENYLIGHLSDVVWQPGEWCVDEVYGTPDGFTLSPIGADEYVRVEEFKCTWYSLNKFPSILDAKPYMWQLMGNCKALKTLYARLHVLWVNGNYKPPSPKYMTYSIEFTQTELDMFWKNVIVKYRDRAIPEKH